jgi:Domain of unknown function (DUF4410)
MRNHFVLIAAAILFSVSAAAKNQPKFKSIEVRHFSQAEGVELPPEFSDFLYAEIRANLQKKKLADQLPGENEVVDPADAAQSVILEGSVLEYKKGSVVKESLIGFGMGMRSLSTHVKLTRRSDNKALIDKDVKVRASSKLDPKHLAKYLAGEITGELKHQPE